MNSLEKYKARINEMMLGIQELANWLIDVAAQGFAGLHQQDFEYFDNIASRLVDLKLGSLARRIRSLEKLRKEPNWLEHFQYEIANLYLIVQAYKQFPNLETAQRFDLLQLGGLNLKKAEILEQQTPILDHWVVLAQVHGKDERLRFRRTWLWGESYQDSALILDFVFGEQDFDKQFEVGTAIEAALCFYPGAMPLRALVKEYSPQAKVEAQLEGIATFEQFNFQYARALTESIALYQYPVLFSAVIPIFKDEEFFLVDNEGFYLPFSLELEKAWKLLALSGNYPIMLFGTWDGQVFTPLTIIHEKRIIPL